ncbi:MAG: SAM-dependent methyltransferase [Gimesia sp.]|uniref:SAM-dependent methyltransferase n=1 Tax=Gimesia maris TaxID=122 RepID=A0A3D3RA97_9PLAN|nr:SAM-dependent methyltransferase [Gimesia sp.]HCO25008.1 SAM-dependent methyltransferase [Gimesia maris]
MKNPDPSRSELALPDVIMKSLEGGDCIQLLLCKPIDKQVSAFKKVTVRPLVIKGKPHYQFALLRGRQEVHENLLREESVLRIIELWTAHFREGYLFTQHADYHFRKTKQGTISMKKHAPTKALEKESETHNRKKQYLIPEGVPCAFLEAIGVMTDSGKVKSAQYHKFRQINRYMEFINDIVPSLSGSGELNIVDFGCGKSYLTFATHYLFTEILKRRVNITGLDLKQSVVTHCQKIADDLQYDGLTFETGDISRFQSGARKCDLSISLHACDTATDAAIAAAVCADTDVIMAVPCCQHEIFQQISSLSQSGLLNHGILKEKTASLVTDALRALMLEICGYRTQVIEFIETEHTPKNLLIRAVKRQPRLPMRELRELIRQFQSLKDQYGIDTFYLEQALGEHFQKISQMPGHVMTGIDG